MLGTIKEAEEILPAGTKCKKCGCTSFRQGERDIMDVWFDSGVDPWLRVIAIHRDDLTIGRLDLYLEGA